MDPTSSELKEIFCQSELSYFPVSEFVHTNGKLYEPHIHHTDRPHYTNGSRYFGPIPPGGAPNDPPVWSTPLPEPPSPLYYRATPLPSEDDGDLL